MKETKSQEVVEGRIIRVREGNMIGPVLRSSSEDAPAKGKLLVFSLGDGKKYTGKVASTERVDGELSVKFQDGYKPV